MELVQCKQNVLKKLKHDFIEVYPPVILFKKGHLYPTYQDIHHNWLATDEQGEEHIIAENVVSPSSDYWFNTHFEMKS